MGRKILYQRGDYRVLAWAEQPVSVGPTLYVAIEQREPSQGWAVRDADQFWRNVKTIEALAAPAPWWNLWARRRELPRVLEEAIALVDQRERQWVMTRATLEAMAEAMELAPGGS